MKKKLSGILILILFLLMLFFPRLSADAARDGLLLWYETLVPTLFPMMILSGLLIRTNAAALLTGALSRPFTALLGISPCGLYAVIVGFFCGCPMGAKVLADLRKSGRISRVEAVYLVPFCNNVSPAFLIHFLVGAHLRSDALTAPTLCILMSAPLLYALLSNRRFRMAERQASKAAAPDAEKKTSATAIRFAMVDVCISDSIASITKLGAYVILFSVLTAMTGALPLQAPLAKAMLAGITEVSGGIHTIASLSLPFLWKYPLLIAVSAFGGLCCAAQSAQMLRDIGLPLSRYLAARLSIAAIAVVMAVCYVR